MEWVEAGTAVLDVLLCKGTEWISFLLGISLDFTTKDLLGAVIGASAGW